MSSFIKSLSSISTILVLLAIFLFFNAISSVVLGRFYLDLTNEGLYSLSEGSKSIASKLQEPIHLRFYYSKTDSSEIPGVRIYGDRVLNLLREFERAAGGKIKLEVYDPRPDSEDAEWAQKYGLTPISGNNGKLLFVGLAGSNSFGQEESIPILDHRRQEYLEYDIAKLIDSLSNSKKAKIAVLSSLDIRGAKAQSPFAQPVEPWFISTQLTQMGDVNYLEGELESIDADVSLLVIIHPKNLSDKTFKAIDSFVMRGGNLLVFVDPFCQSDQPTIDPNNPAPVYDTEKSSSLNRLLKGWGVTMEEKKVVVNARMAESVRVPNTGEVTKFPLWVKVADKSFSANDIVSNGLNYMLFPWAGALKVSTVAGIKVENLITTDNYSHLVDERLYKFGGGDPASLLQQFAGEGEAQILAVRISGKLPSNFSDTDTANGTGEQNFTPVAGGDAKFSEKSNVIVVSDVDLLADQFSVISQSIFGAKVYQMRSDNAVFALNAVENLLGSNDLISLRSRGKFSRDFEKVRELEGKAQQRWKNEELQLQAELDQANARLNELQSVAGQGSNSKQVLSDAVLQEIRGFQAKRAETQSRLRKVRGNLRQEIESLGQTLFFINTFLVPLLLIVVSILYFRAKVARRARK